MKSDPNGKVIEALKEKEAENHRLQQQLNHLKIRFADTVLANITLQEQVQRLTKDNESLHKAPAIATTRQQT